MYTGCAIVRVDLSSAISLVNLTFHLIKESFPGMRDKLTVSVISSSVVRWIPMCIMNSPLSVSKSTWTKYSSGAAKNSNSKYKLQMTPNRHTVHPGLSWLSVLHAAVFYSQHLIMGWHFGCMLWFLLVSSRQPQGKSYDLERTEKLQPRDIFLIVLTVVSKQLSILDSVVCKGHSHGLICLGLKLV